MSNLIVLAFKNEDGARNMRDKLVQLQKEHLIKLEDAAIVIRKQNGKVRVKQLVSLVGTGTLGGAFWGLLIGMIFWVPWLGMAVGAASGALGGALADFGVDDDFIKKVGKTIEPGHSALFLLISESTDDKLADRLQGFGATVLQTSLSKEDEQKMKDIFAADEVEA